MRGAYLLFVDVKLPLNLEVGALGMVSLPAGRYVYVGSARGSIEGRVARHRRLAEEKAGKIHWHIDYVLVNRHTQWVGEEVLEDGIECTLSKRISAKDGVSTPVPGFGASDCRSGCVAHLYLLPKVFRNVELTRKPKAPGTRKRR